MKLLTLTTALFVAIIATNPSTVNAQQPEATAAGSSTSGGSIEPKKYYELTTADLQAHPVWALALDVRASDEADLDDDTSLVLPLPAEGKVRDAIVKDFMLYVRTTFTAKDGTTFTGMMKSNEGTGAEQTQPVIITPKGTVDLYHGYRTPPQSEVQERYSILGMGPEKLFPLKYEADVKFPGRATSGVLEGVYYLDEDKQVKWVK